MLWYYLHNVPQHYNDNKMGRHNAIDYPVQQIADWIAEGKTQAWIGQQLGLDGKLIYKCCKKHGIKCQRTGPRSGPEHPEWQGGRLKTESGYIKVYQPDHWTCSEQNKRRAEKAGDAYYRKQKYAWEHRLIMEEHLGRRLKPSEVVHHKNGVKDDNRIENLQLFSSNAEHLAFDLAERCPNWTEDGKARLRAQAEKRKANRRLKLKRGEHPMPERHHRRLESLYKSVAY
jgi:hypothetical protein